MISTKIQVFYDALVSMEEAIAEMRSENKFGDAFKRLMEKDVCTDLIYIVKEIRGFYRNEEVLIPDFDLEKLLHYLEETTDQINMVYLYTNIETKAEQELNEIYRKTCRELEIKLYEAQLLMEDV
ncbi:MAG: hypothetical protein GFH27_549307n78 [Chloroflexi bacterium AL-W]|nr:hypothetical protein [Chloroflexi bacterium AL-W]